MKLSTLFDVKSLWKEQKYAISKSTRAVSMKIAMRQQHSNVVDCKYPKSDKGEFKEQMTYAVLVYKTST